MNNGTSQQNDIENQPINQTPLTRTIDGIYRQRFNNYNINNQLYPQQIIENPIQEESMYTPIESSYESTPSQKSIDGIYKQTKDSYQNYLDNKTHGVSNNQNIKYRYNSLNSQTSKPYTPNYRNTSPSTHFKSVDGMTTRPKQYNNYNHLYQQTLNQEKDSYQHNQKPYPSLSRPQSEKHIPVTTNPLPTSQQVENTTQTAQPDIQYKRTNYVEHNSNKAKNTIYLDVINTILLLSILFVTILILLKS